MCAALTRRSDRDTVLRLAQDVIIPATTEAVVKLIVPYRFRRKTSLIETFPPIKNKFLAVAGALIHPLGQDTVCRIANVGKTSKHLKANTPVAQISPIDFSDPFNHAMLSVDSSTDN